MPKEIIIPAGTSKPLAPYVPATKVDNIVYVSGTLAFDENNNVVHVGDAAAQTRHILETIKRVIEEAGGSMDDVTFNHVFVKDWADYAAINTVYAEYFPEISRHGIAYRQVWSNLMRWSKLLRLPMYKPIHLIQSHY